MGSAPLLLIPLAGFALLLAAPDADVRWEHHPAHFWLVLGSAALSVVLAFTTSEVARRRGDARLVLVSLAFLAAAGFLGLHALATPKVLLDTPNQGFQVATPVGLLLAGLLAAASALPLAGARAAAVVRRGPVVRLALLALMAAWAVVSLAELPPLDDATPLRRGETGLVALAVLGLAGYAFAAVRYASTARAKASELLWACTAAWVLLAEAMIAVAWSRNWHASWWEWHILMLGAFAVIAIAVRRAPPPERYSDLYLDETAAGSREISVVFADLAGYTSFSEGRDPVEVSEMLNTYFEAAIPPIVRRHGGVIDRVIGDAVMATFNTRGDQPDHARRAALAALDLQRETARITSEHPGWPRFRVGVNTGQAMVGVVGHGDGRTYTVIGDTVNTAARLESAAPVGGVLIGGATLAELPGARVTALGDVAVKGKKDGVPAYVLEAFEGTAGAS